ncbi:MAG: hypothetical protein WC782_16070 [Methylococcaceae bacterium]|jgi:hypothetical protein
MIILDQAVLLAGYLLAHSALNLSYINEVKVLTPFSICLKNGQLQSKFHKGTNQAEAVALAKDELKLNQSKCDAWAFAREGTLEENGRLTNTLSVSSWSAGMQEPIVLVQRFEREPKFKLINDPIIGVDGAIAINSEQSKNILSLLYKGISQHEDGGLLWSSWH